MKYLIKPVIALSMVLAVLPAWSEVQHLLIQSSANKGEELFEVERTWLDKMEKESDGQVVFDLVPVDSVVFYEETLDAMRLGTLDGAFSALEYVSDKDPGIGLLSNTVGAWSDGNDLLRFMYDGSGNAILAKFYNTMGIHLVGSFTTGLEAFVSKVPVDKVADLVGLKIRVPNGMVENVFKAAGAKTIILPINQINDALKSGRIDAADATVFAINQNSGQNRLAPNPVFPGFHSVPVLDFSIAQKKWQELPSSVQNLLTRSIREFAEQLVAKIKKQDLEAVAIAEKDPSITVHNWTDAERKKFRTIAESEWKKVSKQSPLAAQTYNAIVKFLKQNNLL